MNLSELTPPQLLALHAKLCDELRSRGITRSANNPTGDLAEYLFCKAFGWTQAGNLHGRRHPKREPTNTSAILINRFR